MIIRSKINSGYLVVSKAAGPSRKLFYLVGPTYLGVLAIA